MIPATADELAATLRPFFDGRPEVVLAYLFGSRARGDAHARSDVDVAYWADVTEPDPRYRWGGYQVCVMTDVGDLLGTNRVDAVDLRRASPLLSHRVLRDGILLVCRDEPLRIHLWVRTLQRYEDWKRLHRISWFYLRRRIQEGRFGLP